jgi:hypothetical protein
MPVFKCTSCGRLLHRLEEFLGRSWQCPACGPFNVPKEAVNVSQELARLLESEYELLLLASVPEFAMPPSSGPAKSRVHVSSVAWPAMRAGHTTPRRSSLIQADWKVVLLLLGLMLALFPLGAWAWVARPVKRGNDEDGFLSFALVWACGSFTIAVVGLLILGIKELSRQRWLKKARLPGRAETRAAGGQPVASAGDEHIERRRD